MSGEGDEPLDDAWVVVPAGRVPEQWRGRGMHVVVIPLLPKEARTVLSGGGAIPELGPEDERVLRLVACGRAASGVAQELGISTRGAQHRLARLRRRFNVQTTADLAVLAARLGFAHAMDVEHPVPGDALSPSEPPGPEE